MSVKGRRGTPRRCSILRVVAVVEADGTRAHGSVSINSTATSLASASPRRGCILEQRSVLEARAGLLHGQLFEPLDLCKDCSGLFLGWLKAGHQAAHVEPGNGISVAIDSLPV
jgi:hypothetical protein